MISFMAVFILNNPVKNTDLHGNISLTALMFAEV